MSLVQDIAILKKIPMLADFQDDQLRLLAFSAEALEYLDGQTLFDEGERADGGLVVAEGEVSLQQRQKSGFTETDKAPAGSLLGESALLIETRRPCRAVAIGRVRVIRIRRALFKRMIQEYPDLARQLFELHAARYQATVNSLKPIAQKMVELEEISMADKARVKKNDQ